MEVKWTGKKEKKKKNGKRKLTQRVLEEMGRDGTGEVRGMEGGGMRRKQCSFGSWYQTASLEATREGFL